LEKTLNRFRNNKFIIFPSTIYFSDKFESNHMKKNFFTCLNRTKKILFYARESKTFDLVKSNVDTNVRVYEVPDIALYLIHRDFNFTNKRESVGLCIRKDKESTNSFTSLYLNSLKKYKLKEFSTVKSRTF